VAVKAVTAPRPSSEKAPATPGRAWWVEPTLTVVCYTAFVIYATWSVFSGTYVYADPYLSPFFSPSWGIIHLPFHLPVIGVLIPVLAIIPLGLRASCYYYRKSYYRSFMWDPPGCALRDPRQHYAGETKFPWVLNNYHRYFLVLSVIVIVFLWIDVIRAFIYHGHFFVGLGSFVMLVNVVLLSLYTFSCHSLRYLVGGRIDCYSCVRGGNLWQRLSRVVDRINPLHGTWAWYSMFSVALTDVYIRLVMSGIIHEPRWVF
jgi:hypothetical protein